MVMIEYHQYNANTPLQWGVSMVSENAIQMLTNNAKENAMLSDIYALCHFCPVPVPVPVCQYSVPVPAQRSVGKGHFGLCLSPNL